MDSCTLGLTGPGAARLSSHTWTIPSLSPLLCVWARWQGVTDVHFSSIQRNINFRTARHRDQGNEGPSAMKSLGTYAAGGLLVWLGDDGAAPISELSPNDATCFDPRSWIRFNGNQAHETLNFTGYRITLVFYLSSSFSRASERDIQFLREAGAVLP